MDIHAMHAGLITLHAATATLSFFMGCYLIFALSDRPQRRLFDLYWWSLVGMVVFLLGAMVVYWSEYAAAERVVFSGLFVLGMYMVFRAQSASSLLESQQSAWKDEYIEHIGFTLISLFEGFIIVAVLNAGGAGWLVAVVAVLGVLLGRQIIGLAQRRVERNQTVTAEG